MIRRRGWLLCTGLLVWWPVAAGATEEDGSSELSQLELEAWLDGEPTETGEDDASSEQEAPPLPPRRQGLVVEGSVGALGHLGDMQVVSPISPWFRLHVGYELFGWLMVFGAGDVALSSTALANRPPEKRSYALFGVSTGARLAWQPFAAVGAYLQPAVGLASVNHDVLSTYGYPDADRLRPFAEGTLGIEWFQVSSHYGLSLYGGARDYFQSFERINGTKAPIVWLSGLAIRYAL